MDEKVDMWALGVVMWVILTGRHPFDAGVNLSEEDLARRVAEQEPDLRVRVRVSFGLGWAGGSVICLNFIDLMVSLHIGIFKTMELTLTLTHNPFQPQYRSNCPLLTSLGSNGWKCQMLCITDCQGLA